MSEGHLPRPLASVDNTFLDLQNSSYPTKPSSIIARSLDKVINIPTKKIVIL